MSQYGARCLTRRRVCNFWLLLGFTSPLCLGPGFRGAHDHTVHLHFHMETESEGHPPPPLPGPKYLQETWWLSGVQNVPQANTNTSTANPITTHPKHKRYCLLWCIGPELSVIKTACRPSWSSRRTSSNRMDTTTRRSTELSTVART
jgi:hypothetical protein